MDDVSTVMKYFALIFDTELCNIAKAPNKNLQIVVIFVLKQ